MSPEGISSSPAPPASEEELDRLLASPTPFVLDTLRRQRGDVLVLGAGGKMGPSLVRMLRQACASLGDDRRIAAVSRFQDADTERALRQEGIETIRADLADAAALRALPDVPYIFHLAGQKFGTTGDPDGTWRANAFVPSLVADRFRDARIVALSTGNVYPLGAVRGPGAREDAELAAWDGGEYVRSCVARERIFEHFSRCYGTPVALVRLSYAVDLRYGVLVDLAQRVRRAEAVDVTMGYANVIWQGDAVAQTIACLPHAASPPFTVNVTGHEAFSVRAMAERFAARFGAPLQVKGEERADALLSDTARARALFGDLSVPLEVLAEWVAAWVERGGRSLGRPTHFEVRDGRF